MITPEKIDQVVIKYANLFNDIAAIHIVYIDGVNAFEKNIMEIDQKQKKILEIAELVQDENVKRIVRSIPERIQIVYEKEETGYAGTYPSNVEEYKSRNAHGGRNYEILGNITVVYIYQLWEKFRPDMEKFIGLKTDALKSDFFRDLNQLRNCILKRLGNADKMVNKNTIIKWFKEGENISFTKEQFNELIKMVYAELANQLAEVLTNYCVDKK